jgi:predicted anti-sigma-YlaC factor YlaD
VHVSTLIAGKGCDRARASMSAAIDKEACADELLAAASHLADCEDCRRFVAEIGTVTRVLRSTERSADRRRHRLQRG